MFMRDLSPLEYRALAEFRHQVRRFLHFSEEQTRSAGVEPQQHQLMLALKGLPPGKRATISELAARLLLKHHSTVELIDRLEARGAVIRLPGTDDRREVLVHLTRSGGALLRNLSVSHREELDKTAPELARALRALRRASRNQKVEAA